MLFVFQSERGATPLFYALCDNDCDMVEVLLENGARLDIGMQGENEVLAEVEERRNNSNSFESFLSNPLKSQQIKADIKIKYRL